MTSPGDEDIKIHPDIKLKTRVKQTEVLSIEEDFIEKYIHERLSIIDILKRLDEIEVL